MTMEILCFGLSHHTAPVELREKFAISDHALAAAVARLKATPAVREAVIVSTCNRVEFYVVADHAADGFQAIETFVAAHGGAPESPAFFRLPTLPAIRHLFRVVSGLDSMVLGETEILGQMKRAYAVAGEAGATAKHLNKLFQRAFRVAKAVRTQTNITRGAVSVGSAAAELAEKIFGRLTDCRAMILGAGEMSELTAGALQTRGVTSIFVANRSFERAAVLAQKMNGSAVHFDEWQRHFRDVDILIGSTAAPHHVLTAAELAPIMRARPDRPLFCIDLAVPRDIEPAVNALEGVYLYDIDSLQAIADHSMQIRRQEVALCEEMIERHAQEFFGALAGGWAPGAVAYAPSVSGGAPEGAKS